MRAAREAGARPSERIAFQGFSASERDSTGASCFRAAEVVYRNRSGAAGFIHYHDYAELLASEAHLSIELSRLDGFSSIPEAIASLLALDSEEMASLRPARREVGVAGARGPVVTRLVVKKLAIDLSSPGAGLVVEADRGSQDVDSGTLELSGGVRLRTERGQEIRAAKAVLSRRRNGLYLPAGHSLDGHTGPGGAFAVLDQNGGLSVTRGGAPISYEDLIAKRERLVLVHYADRAPVSLKPLLIAILSGMGAHSR